MLVERVARLEQQNRRLKAALVIVVIAICGVAATIAPPSMSAGRYTLIDNESRTRALLENTAASGRGGSSNPMLTFYDKMGQPRITFGIGQRGPTLEVIDDAGKAHEYLGTPTIRPATQ